VKHKLYIFDDHPVVIEGLKKLLEGQDEFQIVGTASDEATALDQIAKLKPDIAIIDISAKDRSGVDIIKKIKSASEGVLVLVFSMHDENVYAERSLRAGAMGYLMKSEPVSRVLLAVRQVLGGGFFFSASLLASIVSGGSLRSSASRGEPGRLLSDRQLEIFEMVGRGMDSHGIAAKLELSSKTVDAHKANIRQKLGLESARELLMEAVRWVEK
jgi:DNA-binding NarL/FixJ family response regulator